MAKRQKITRKIKGFNTFMKDKDIVKYHLKTMWITFDKFEVNDIVLDREQTDYYIVYEVRKCKCPCNVTDYIKVIYIDGLERKVFKFSDFDKCERLVFRPNINKVIKNYRNFR
jgi:hypothetical protein